jgi:uncharacterized protein YdeI (YjbR/CyaY-like superfamily)
MENRLSPETIEEWTQWLKEHSENEVLVWLRIKRKKSKKTGIYLDEAVTEALRFGWIDGRLNPMDEDYFWLRFSLRKPKSVWSLINRKRVELMIENKTLTARGYQTVEWAKQNGIWQASYTSFKDTHIPIEFVQSLERNSEAQKRYDTLSNADKLKLLYWLNTTQSNDQFNNRLNRIISWLESDKPINQLKTK